jgi:hypothetical protein
VLFRLVTISGVWQKVIGGVMNGYSWLVGSIVLAAAATTAVGAELVVGDSLPEASLVASDGARRSTTAIGGPAVLIFYRGLW